jgi:predicted MFS family arabinose efflux permease
MSIAMIFVAVYLLLFPALSELWHAAFHAVLLGASGGVVTVIFFTSYGKLFGRLHLGKIQGIAQIFTVLASASGPWLLAKTLESSGSYQPAFQMLAAIAILIALIAWSVSLPDPLKRTA